MNNVEVDAPKGVIKEEILTEQEAYKKAQEINQKGQHQAKVENGKLKVQEVLKG